jgi:hypothetical protein
MIDEFYKEIVQKYPDIAWAISPPAEGVNESFGPGFMLAGQKDGKVVDYFIPDEVTDRGTWADAIADQLH